MKKIAILAYILTCFYVSALEKIKFDKMDLSVEKAIGLAQSVSYDYMVKQIELNNLDITLASNWMQYLPSIDLVFNGSNKFFEAFKIIIGLY